MIKIYKLIIAYIILFLLLIGCSILFSSCTLTRKVRQTTKDSVQVSKIDTGRVTINTDTKKDSSAWWREIISFLPKGRDTIINNTTIPVNNYYPSQIIREGGTAKSESKVINYDSIWNNRMDSLVARLTTKQSDAKFKVLDVWQILGICSGVSLFFFLAGRLKFK